jgi:hypothetical protein
VGQNPIARIALANNSHVTIKATYKRLMWYWALRDTRGLRLQFAVIIIVRENDLRECNCRWRNDIHRMDAGVIR